MSGLGMLARNWTISSTIIANCGQYNAINHWRQLRFHALHISELLAQRTTK